MESQRKKRMKGVEENKKIIEKNRMSKSIATKKGGRKTMDGRKSKRMGCKNYREGKNIRKQ